MTGTVEAIPLIASSIMSKKIAEGTGALVLDVKVGTGAFMKSIDDARELARTMVELGERAGRAHGRRCSPTCPPRSGWRSATRSRSTESVEVLAGGGPADVVELTLALAREMLDLAGLPDADPAEALADGRAMDSWRAMIRAQGGDPDAPMPTAPRDRGGPRRPRTATWPRSTRTRMGLAAWRLGAGRARKEDPVSVPAGVVLHRRPGDPVPAGDVLYELRADDAARIPAAAELGRGRRHDRALRRPPAAAGAGEDRVMTELIAGGDPHAGARRQGHRRVRRAGQQRRDRAVGRAHGGAGRLGGAGADARVRRVHAGAARHACGSSTRAASIDVSAGQAVVTRAGERIRYTTPTGDGAEYVAICLPAFAPDLAHRDDDRPVGGGA